MDKDGLQLHQVSSKKRRGIKGFQVKFTHPLELIKQVSDSRKRIFILYDHFVQLALVNINSKRPILLSNKQHRRTPWRNT